MEKVVAGIDIGGTFTKYGIVDINGEFFGQGSIQTDLFPDIDTYIHQLSSEILGLQKDCGMEIKIAGIGIGAPNGNYYSGIVEHAPNLNWKGVVPLADLMKKAMDVPVVLTNDANAAALGEMMYGGAGSMKDFILITLGTGLGSGIVVNGHLVYGHDGFAGEMGHIIAMEDGRQCGCGRKGCLETYVSASGIKRTVFELLANMNQDSVLKEFNYEQMTAKEICRAAENGDRIASLAFETTGEILGKKLADAVALFSPEAIFLLGGLTNAGDLILNPVKEHMEKNLLSVFRGKVKILPSGLAQNNAAVLGAAGLIWKEITD